MAYDAGYAAAIVAVSAPVPEAGGFASGIARGRMGVQGKAIELFADNSGALSVPRLSKLTPAQRAAAKGYKGVGTTANGGPTFIGSPYLYAAESGQSSVVSIALTGSRKADNAAAFLEAGIKMTPAIRRNYRWHHVDDFGSATGLATMELVQRRVHEVTVPHAGGVRQWEAFTGKKYRR